MGALPGLAVLPKVAVILAVLLSDRVPEGEIEGVEGSVGDNRLVGHEGPVNSVGRGLTIRVLERREDEGPIPFENDVVVGGPGKLDDAQRRPRPLDAIGALGVANNVVVGPAVVSTVDLNGGYVVHPVRVAVLEDGDVAGVVAIPWLVKAHGDFLRRGLLEHTLGAVEPVDEVVVDE